MNVSFTLNLSFVAIWCATAAIAQNPFPKTWSRAADWVAHENPGTDSAGHKIWFYGLRNGHRPHAMRWDAAWRGWLGAGSAKFSGGGVVNANGLVHMPRLDIWKCHYCITPVIRFDNVTKRSFDLAFRGDLVVSWTGPNATSIATDVDVTFEFFDASQAKSRVLWTQTVAKPTPGKDKGSVRITPTIPGVRVDPDDEIRWTVIAKNSGTTDTWIILNDRDLVLERRSLAGSAVQRFASPRNGLELMPEKSNRPVIGKTWDPYIRNPPVGATLDFLAFGPALPAGGVSLPFGTLLCDPAVVLTGPPGVPFTLAIPNDSALVGIQTCVQGASAVGAQLTLANALDVVIGDR